MATQAGEDSERAATATKKMQLQMSSFQESFNRHGDNMKELCSKYGKNTHPEVAQMRSCITKNTHLYLVLLLHASVTFVQELQQVMTNYCSPDMTFGQFVDSIADIAEEAQACAAMAEFVRDLHAALADDLDAAFNIDEKLAKLDLERRSLGATSKLLDAKCERQQSTQTICELLAHIVSAIYIVGAAPSAGISLVGLAPAAALGIAGHVFEEKLAATSAKVIDLKQQIVVAADAARAITGPIRASLRSLSDALAAATQFFTVINTEVQAYRLNADRAARLKLGNPEAVRLQQKLEWHYKLMKTPAKNLVDFCCQFEAVIIKTKTMLMRLLDGVEYTTNEQFVKDWLTEKSGRLRLDQDEGREARIALLPTSLCNVLPSPGSRSGTQIGSHLPRICIGTQALQAAPGERMFILERGDNLHKICQRKFRDGMLSLQMEYNGKKLTEESARHLPDGVRLVHRGEGSSHNPRPAANSSVVPDGSVDKAVDATISISDALTRFCENFNGYANTLQALYDQHDTGHPAVVQTRTAIMNSTQLYLKEHLPASQKFIAALQQVLTNYTSLEYDEFEACLSEIADLADICASEAEGVRCLHAKLADEAESIVDIDLELETRDLQIKALEAQLAQMGLSSPDDSDFAGHLHDGNMDAAIAKLTAARQDMENAQLAAVEIAGPVKTFVRACAAALSDAVRFFEIVRDEIQAYARSTEVGIMPNKACVAEEDKLTRKLKQHYLLIKPVADQLEQQCIMFDAAIFRTRRMLERLVEDDAGHVAYTKEWLEAKLQAGKVHPDRPEGRKLH